MELSGYDLIKDFGLDYCISQKLIFALAISSDVQSYVEEFAQKEFTEISEKKIMGKLNILWEELQNTKTPNKSDYKKVYLAFIKRIIKEHHVSKERGMNLDGFEKSTPQKTIEDEVEKIFGETGQVKLEQKRQKLERRYEPAGLSDIEKHALNFIADRKQKDKSLEHFTLNGIFQIANRATLKIYFQKNS